MDCAVLGEIGKGLSEALLFERRPVPEAGEGEVLLQVLAVGVNPSDVRATMGAFPYAMPGKVAGRDCCGRVLQGPPALLGKLVWTTSGKERGLAGDGNLAEYARLPAAACLPVPKGVSALEAGAMGVPLCTAACVVAKADVRRGETLAVAGANGQVGRFIQGLARWKGAKTVGIVRSDVYLPYADHKVVGTVDQDMTQKLKEIGNIDVMVDCVGIGTEHLLEALGHRGRLVLLAAPSPGATFPLPIRSFYRRDLTLLSVETMQHGAVSSAEIVRSVLPAFDAGALRPPRVHEEVFPLARAREAYGLVLGGCPKRVVVAPGGGEAEEALRSSNI